MTVCCALAFGAYFSRWSAVFDSEELLEASIRSIRSNVDYINIIYQKVFAAERGVRVGSHPSALRQVSNFGNAASPGLEHLVLSLRDQGLVDDVVCYTPKARHSRIADSRGVDTLPIAPARIPNLAVVHRRGQADARLADGHGRGDRRETVCGMLPATLQRRRVYAKAA